MGYVAALLVVVLGMYASGTSRQNTQIDQAAIERQASTTMGVALEMDQIGSAAIDWAHNPANWGRTGDIPLSELRLTKAAGETYNVITPWRVIAGPVTDGTRSGLGVAVICDSACASWLAERNVGVGPLVKAAYDNGNGFSGIGLTRDDGWMASYATKQRTMPLPAGAKGVAGVTTPVFAGFVVDPATEPQPFKIDSGAVTEICYLQNPPGCPDPRGASSCKYIQKPGTGTDGQAACPSPDPACPAAFPLGNGKVFNRVVKWRNSVAHPARAYAATNWFKLSENCSRIDTATQTVPCPDGQTGRVTATQWIKTWSDGRDEVVQDWTATGGGCQVCNVGDPGCVCDWRTDARGCCQGGMTPDGAGGCRPACDSPDCVKVCPDGRLVPANGVCTPVHPLCPDGSPMPADEGCRCPHDQPGPPRSCVSLPKACDDGTVIPADRSYANYCVCPDGSSKVANGGSCPTWKRDYCSRMTAADALNAVPPTPSYAEDWTRAVAAICVGPSRNEAAGIAVGGMAGKCVGKAMWESDPLILDYARDGSWSIAAANAYSCGARAVFWGASVLSSCQIGINLPGISGGFVDRYATPTDNSLACYLAGTFNCVADAKATPWWPADLVYGGMGFPRLDISTGSQTFYKGLECGD